jgi:hypothetical protein
MQDLLGGTRLVDAVLAVTVLEALALLLLHALRGRGPAPAEWALNLLSGLCLMLALRAALAQAASQAQPACLAAAGLAHGLDIARRWRRAAARVRPS